jgi:hypothetical protein
VVCSRQTKNQGRTHEERSEPLRRFQGPTSHFTPFFHEKPF